MLCITESAPHYVLKSSYSIALDSCCPWSVLKTLWMGKDGRKRKEKKWQEGKKTRSALRRSEACRAATDTALVGGATAGEYLQAFVFYFLGRVSSTNTCAYAVLSLALTGCSGLA